MTESIIGVRNGFNRQFILSHIPIAETLEVYRLENGERRKIGAKLISENTVEIDYAPDATQTPMADYKTATNK